MIRRSIIQFAILQIAVILTYGTWQCTLLNSWAGFSFITNVYFITYALLSFGGVFIMYRHGSRIIDQAYSRKNPSN